MLSPWNFGILSARNGDSCMDKDECITGEDDCNTHSICSNTVGSFLCTCKPGFYEREGDCHDIDECIRYDLNDCSVEEMRCENTFGSYKCLCKLGLFITSPRTLGSFKAMDEMSTVNVSMWTNVLIGKTIAKLIQIVLIPLEVIAVNAS